MIFTTAGVEHNVCVFLVFFFFNHLENRIGQSSLCPSLQSASLLFVSPAQLSSVVLGFSEQCLYSLTLTQWFVAADRGKDFSCPPVKLQALCPAIFALQMLQRAVSSSGEQLGQLLEPQEQYPKSDKVRG